MTGRTVIFQNPASGTSNHETRSRVRDLLAGDGDTVEEVIVNPGMTLLERRHRLSKMEPNWSWRLVGMEP
jgi:hypothetical protein